MVYVVYGLSDWSEQWSTNMELITAGSSTKQKADIGM